MVTNAEIHFLPVDESHTHALYRDWHSQPCLECIGKHHALKIRWPGLLLQAAFCDAVKPQGCISWPVWPLRGINKTAWCQADSNGKLGLPCELCQSGSPTDGTALSFVFECLRYYSCLPQKPGAFK